MVQYARPDADTDVGDWQNSDYDQDDLFSFINEAAIDGSTGTYDDDDYIYVEDSGSGSECTISLGSVTDPVSGSGHSVVVRAADVGGGGTITLNVNLKDGGTSIKNENFTPGGTPGNHTMTLSTAQANNISGSGYGNLSLVLTSTDGMSMGMECAVYFAYFTCPEAGGGGSTPIAAIAMNTYRQMRN